MIRIYTPQLQFKWKSKMRMHLLTFLLLLCPMVSADMDKICPIFTENYGWNDIAKEIKNQGCVRNDILQLAYGMENPNVGMLLIQSNYWCRFDRNRDIEGNVLSCVLYSTEPRKRLDLTTR
jgi:hypothetical protein